MHVLGKLIVADAGPLALGRDFSTDRKSEMLSHAQRDLFGDIARPNRWPLGIQENSYGPLMPLRQETYVLDHSSHPFWFGVTHVEPQNIGPCENESLEHLWRIGGRSESSDDFGLPETVDAHGFSIRRLAGRSITRSGARSTALGKGSD